MAMKFNFSFRAPREMFCSKINHFITPCYNRGGNYIISQGRYLFNE